MATVHMMASRRLLYRVSRTSKQAFQLQQQRTFIPGLGEIMGILMNPGDTLRQLNESKQQLQKAKEDYERQAEAKKIPKKHTFSKLPGFHGRKVEKEMLRKVLSNAPKMTVIFGATSVGKTALLREVLATDDFYTINFDLRISGFANPRTLYIALCEQFERFFEEMHDETMDKQKLIFKHRMMELLEKEKEENGGYAVSVADIASLMESLQSSFLKYWEYDPESKKEDDQANGDKSAKNKTSKVEVSVGDSSTNSVYMKSDGGSDKDQKPPFKKKPIVFLVDEAHKLPALIDDNLSLKVLLDTLLVLTKQDRLCHVLLSTSDSFFQHFLRSMNVGHHTQVLSIGDCNKEESKEYFDKQVADLVPLHLKHKIDFAEVYTAFGGKLSHIGDYITAWVDSNGELTPYTSAIFLQAYILLQFHLTHVNFETFSPLSTATSGSSDKHTKDDFSPNDLLHVMQRLIKTPYSLPYFQLCREIGTEQVDAMIKTRILELRWTKTIAPEEDWIERQWSKDGVERPIVLPMTRIIRRAMEVILKEEADACKAEPAVKE